MIPAWPFEPFYRLVSALNPWLDQIVIVGGWAHQLYRLHPHAQYVNYAPLTTLDTDIALPATIRPAEQDIRARLLARGFTEQFFGEDHPPATHYRLGGEPSGFYAEFLTPLVGSEVDRAQRRRATVEVAGIVSQQLRYIELLLRYPWSVEFESNDFRATVQIANPVSFVAQKVLIHGRRGREDKAKDILYMHDTLEIFGARLPDLAALWRNRVAPQLSPRALRTISRASEQLFSTLSDDTRRAADIVEERALAPEAIRDVCRYGFSRIFD